MIFSSIIKVQRVTLISLLLKCKIVFPITISNITITAGTLLGLCCCNAFQLFLFFMNSEFGNCVQAEQINSD